MKSELNSEQNGLDIELDCWNLVHKPSQNDKNIFKKIILG